MKLKSYVYGEWIEGTDNGVPLFNAVNGDEIYRISSKGVDFSSVLDFGRENGKVLRNFTFHDRALMLKKLALYLLERKEKYYEISYLSGATKADSWIDIEGGIATMFAYSGKARRELPNEKFYLEGNAEPLSKKGSFIGHHICVPLQGVAIHINAFNFPIWGMLEKFSPSFIAGIPCIIKPASLTAYLTEIVVKDMIESNILPDGALQLICGSTGNLLDNVDGQDVVTFTGSATTGRMLKSSKAVVQNSVRFNMEADSLNASILGTDAIAGTQEFDLYVKEILREMTVKAGQKCTSIRRAIIPENLVEDVIKAVNNRLAKNQVGDPKIDGVRMGPLAGKSQQSEVEQRVAELLTVSERVTKSNNEISIIGGDFENGSFFAPTLLYCDKPFDNEIVHSVEAFGPVTTILPYKTIDEAIELSKLGKGSLVSSIFTIDNNIAKDIFLGTASYHGRIMIINKDSGAESTGHGSPMPQLVHGGPGRAGGGEELGGIRAVLHYMQRTAIQGHPTTITTISNSYQKGAEKFNDNVHPFRKHFEDLKIGESITSHKRTITEADVSNFANLSWDHFYAHTDETSLEGTIFERRVAHGYFVMSAAAGLFVDPAKGPVMANYGIDEVRFIMPVYSGDTIWVNLTVKEKIDKENKGDMKPNGVVKWDVEVYNQRDEQVAQATILTLVEKSSK